jgi:hypothetical protein
MRLLSTLTLVALGLVAVLPTNGKAADTVGRSSWGTNGFLNSLGVNTHMGQGISETSYAEPLKYLGIRHIRDGDGVANTASRFVSFYRQTGIRVLIHSKDFNGTLSAAKQMAAANALLAIEGPNEPNNWPVTYQGQTGGGSGSWLPVARFQRDLYAAVKADPKLAKYPVFNTTEPGAETDNVGLQFLTIPSGAGTLMPEGTKYADFANLHNYVPYPGARAIVENMAWHAADPLKQGPWDGLYLEHGLTWARKYRGYSSEELINLPRVTTESGWGTGSNGLTEAQQGKLFLNVYCAQYRRGFKYTFIYQLRDGEGGDNASMGLFRRDSSPKLAATYIRNLTTILADNRSLPTPPGKLNYKIPNQPATVHDLLLRKTNGTFELIVWGEMVSGSTSVTVNLGTARKTVNLYDPTTGASSIRQYTDVASVPLTLSDHPVIIEIVD